jgi:hypothetical protein
MFWSGALEIGFHAADAAGASTSATSAARAMRTRAM